MKQRKIILCTLCIFYVIATAGVLFYHIMIAPGQEEAVPAASSFQGETVAAEGKPQEESFQDELKDETEAAAEIQKTEIPEIETPETESPEELQIPEELTAAEEEEFVPIPFTYNAKGKLRIRDIPSLEGNIVANIYPGSSGEITEIVDEEWAAVNYQGITGYCASEFLTFGQDGEETADAPVAAGFVRISRTCNIRDFANGAAPENILGTAETGSVYPHVQELDTPYFYAIQLDDGTVAYVSSDYSAAE